MLNVHYLKPKETFSYGSPRMWVEPFLMALKRRGYQPETFIKYAVDVGISLTDKRVTKEEFFKIINAFNKDVIDAKAYRYFFISNPKEITIENAPEQIQVNAQLLTNLKSFARKKKHT